MKTQHSSTALSYAEALVELADEQGQMESVANDAGAFAEALNENPDLLPFFRDPSITEEERQNVIDKALADATPLLKQFVSVINSRGRSSQLAQILDAVDYVLDQRLGKVEVDVTVAEKLDDAELDKVGDRVGKALGRDAVVHQYVDDSIIGGMILRVGDTVLDASVKRQLDAMRERLRS
jgi:ATP synthase F1 delta subunit